MAEEDLDVSIYASTLQDDFEIEDEPYAPENERHAPPEVEWFHGKLSRDDASKLLTPQPVGSYLVRESTRSLGDYSISFRIPSGIKHFKIISHEYGDYFIADNSFSSLGDVVEFYCNQYLCDNRCLEYPVRPAREQRVQQPRTVVTAIIDYDSESRDELSFKAGDRLTILYEENDQWLWCLRDGVAQVGFVPRAMVKATGREISEREAASQCRLPPQFHRSHWLHGKISRTEAGDMLEAHGKVGSFLIRESTNPIGDYSMSFRGPMGVNHFKISVLEETKYELGGRTFDCLEAIVLHYLEEPLMDETCLKSPLPPLNLNEFEDEGQELYSAVQYSKPPPSRAPASSSISSSTTPASARSPSAKPGSVRRERRSKTGYITRKVKKSKKWKSMYFELVPDKKRLYFYENQENVKPKGIIDVGSSSLHMLDDSFFGRPNCFCIIISGAEVFLCTSTEEERLEWVTAMKDLCASTTIGEFLGDEKGSTTLNTLSVQVSDVKDLSAKAKISCVVSLNFVKHARTPVKAPEKNSAFFGETFSFDNISDSVDDLAIELFQRGKRKDQSIAGVSIALPELSTNKEVQQWYKLMSEGGSKLGSVRLKINYRRDIILPLEEYGALRTALEVTDTTPQRAIAKVAPNLNDYARHLVRLWIHDQKEVLLLSELLNANINQEESVGTLFRGNDLSSKAMDQYMKIVAMAYLHDTVGEVVRQLFEEKRSCEMDPTRGGKPAEGIKVLSFHIEAICKAIYDSVDRCPAPLRDVFQNLQRAVVARFPGEENVRYTAVSAFIFLRLFCPAIINPKLFNMMPDHPTDLTARNLMLVAKSIQNLANMTEFGAKESFMIPVNGLLTQLRGGMVKYLDTISTAGGAPSPASVKAISRDLAYVLNICSAKDSELKKACSAFKTPTSKELPGVVKLLQKAVKGRKPK